MLKIYNSAFSIFLLESPILFFLFLSPPRSCSSPFRPLHPCVSQSLGFSYPMSAYFLSFPKSLVVSVSRPYHALFLPVPLPHFHLLFPPTIVLFLLFLLFSFLSSFPTSVCPPWFLPSFIILPVHVACGGLRKGYRFVRCA